MGCPNRFPGMSCAPALRRFHGERATWRRADAYDARRRANGRRDASRGAVACRTAWPVLIADDAFASECES
ncbi:hypothetical protein BAN20980_00924 [Burkholderia anthina]|uniref:Uncharacterized protein n=1 Tax=Burkholderia anthina TaxID=179879 RepID=A0A6P2G3L2_9BURK|nr:hypothetical protein BAN20980_00924 [Burkholderia anthina]